jgi:Kef-type K+ transport system membrane component KefB
LGGLLGCIFTAIVRRIIKKAEYLIIIFWAVLTGVGLADYWHLSHILVCMVVGFFFVNASSKGLVHSARESLQQIIGLIFVLFFGIAGLHLNLYFVSTLGSIGVVYVVGRSTGKLFGAWLGARSCRMEEKIRRYLGLGILSQAGVAIGLSLLIQQRLARIPGAELIGVQVLSTITATSIIFEIIGPLAARYALKKAGEIKD